MWVKLHVRHKPSLKAQIPNTQPQPPCSICFFPHRLLTTQCCSLIKQKGLIILIPSNFAHKGWKIELSVWNCQGYGLICLQEMVSFSVITAGHEVLSWWILRQLTPDTPCFLKLVKVWGELIDQWRTVHVFPPAALQNVSQTSLKSTVWKILIKPR